MLPTMPRSRVRSMCISARDWFSTSATRASSGVALMRISLDITSRCRDRGRVGERGEGRATAVVAGDDCTDLRDRKQRDFEIVETEERCDDGMRFQRPLARDGGAHLEKPRTCQPYADRCSRVDRPVAPF